LEPQHPLCQASAWPRCSTNTLPQTIHDTARRVQKASIHGATAPPRLSPGVQ
jgi:hypothetical protein